jgi:hypothetical protein
MQEAYYFAKSTYPIKAIALWESGTSDTSNQGRWIEDAYAAIKKLPRIKLIVYYESISGTGDNHMIRDKPTYRDTISDPYFIGSKLM